MQALKPLSTALFVVTAVAIHCSSTTLSVRAAGFDDSSPDEVIESNTSSISSTNPSCWNKNSTTKTSTTTVSKASQQQKPCPLTLEWRRWSLPYTQAGNRCRELNGNLVCVTPQAADRLHW